MNIVSIYKHDTKIVGNGVEEKGGALVGTVSKRISKTADRDADV